MTSSLQLLAVFSAESPGKGILCGSSWGRGRVDFTPVLRTLLPAEDPRLGRGWASLSLKGRLRLSPHCPLLVASDHGSSSIEK